MIKTEKMEMDNEKRRTTTATTTTMEAVEEERQRRRQQQQQQQNGTTIMTPSPAAGMAATTAAAGMVASNSSRAMMMVNGGGGAALFEAAAAAAASGRSNRMMPMDLSNAATLSQLTDAAMLFGAGRSPLGIALSNAVAAGASAASPMLSPIPAAGSGSSNFSTATASPPPPPPTQPRRKNSAQLLGANGQIQSDCLICSDRATGKHYGSISCDGCKGFFRRTIRKKHSYVCRFNRDCVVDKNQRNSCRRCRFEKCLANGMRPEAVQLERDRIAATRRTNVDRLVDIKEELDEPGTGGPPPLKQQKIMGTNDNAEATTPSLSANNMNTNCTNCCTNGSSTQQQHPNSPPEQQAKSLAMAEQTLQRLMDAERTLGRAPRREQQQPSQQPQQQQNSPAGMVTSPPGMVTSPATAMARTATTGDVTDSMHKQLILLVEWAKQLEEFRRLPLRSQIGLLRHFSAQHLVICAAFRSLAVGGPPDGGDAVWLANDRCVPRDAPKIPDVNRVVARILDHLTAPMRRLQLDGREFVALKAVAFFDPMAKDVEESAVSEVEETRQRILAAFEHQVLTRGGTAAKHQMPQRLANLLLLLPPLMAIGRDLVEEAQLAKLFGLANVDELMAELLLPEDAETRSYSRLRTSVTSSIVQSNVTSPTPPTTSPHRQYQQQQQQFHLPPSPSTMMTTATTVATTGTRRTMASSAADGQPPNMPSLAAPTPIYSTSPLLLPIGCAATHQQQRGIGNFGK